MAAQAPQKPIHSLILDTGPLIKNAVSISTIINSAEEIYTTPAIVSEIRDEATRSRVQTTLMPFLKIRNPSPASYDAVIAFSKKTGDHAVLSRQDLGILALAYEIHCERNGGSWGLREAPKQPIKLRPEEEKKAEEQRQKRLKKKQARQQKLADRKQQIVDDEHAGQDIEANAGEDVETSLENASVQQQLNEPVSEQGTKEGAPSTVDIQPNLESVLTESQPAVQDHCVQEDEKTSPVTEIQQPTNDAEAPKIATDQIASSELPNTEQAVHHEVVEEQQIRESEQVDPQPAPIPEELSQGLSSLNISAPPSPPDTDDSDSDGDWITPTNLSERQAADSGLQNDSRTSSQGQMDVATMTIDFAMQNVLLQMNLQLLSTNMQRIKHLMSKVLRCHACFNIVKQMDKQFCPRCGGASLRRVSCSTNAQGEFKIHLAKNYQWNKRGDRYSVPKPIAGTANGKWSGQGGGQGGWGRDLILAEDQKEYQKQMDEDRRRKGARDLMDDDYLPGILTGDRNGGRAGGRPKVGAGKNVNSRKRF